MKLLIKKPFEIDVELVDQAPKYLYFRFNWVLDQTIDVDTSEMQLLIAFLHYSSMEFNIKNIICIDEKTLSWG